MAGRRPFDGTITIGQVVGPFGIQGGIKVKVLTDFLERFEKGREVLIDGEPYVITVVQWHKGQARLKLDGISNRDLAEGLKWADVEVPSDDVPDLDEDEFLTEDLIGMAVVSTDGRNLGQVTEVLASPAHDIIVVGKTMIPAVKEFVTDIDLQSGVMTVQLIEGMLEDE